MVSGMFLGGYFIKRLKLILFGIIKFVFFIIIMVYVFYLLYFFLICENKVFVGLILIYDGFVYIILLVEF